MSDNEAFSVLEIPTAMYTSSPKSLVSEHLSSDLSDDTVVTSLKQDSDNDVVNVTNLSNKVDHPFQKPSQNGLNGKFMSVDKVFQSAQRQKPIGQYIPSGIKENVIFVIDDTYNYQRRLSKKQSEYPDDCGTWDSKKNVTTTKEYIYSNQLLSCVDKKNGLLGRELKKGFVPLQPQPDPASIVVVKRKYSTLSRHNAYKKRITWFECSLGLTNAVVEYIGDYRTNSTVHGNAKRITAPYIRVNMEQKAIIQEGIKHQKPSREIRRQANKTNPDNIIGPKVIHNAKYNMHIASYPDISNRVNVADDILAVLNKFNDSSFIKEVITTNPKKNPSVICYTDEQIKLLITAIENGSVIGVDRTFNLSSCYVTVLCFKNINVIRRNSSNSPIMFGPIFLSWDGQEDTYQRFMSHLQNKLKGVQQSSIMFGTDQETGEINAIKACFPQSTHILCIKHLKDNARENLRKTQLQPVVNTILHKIFNEDGLLHSNCEIVYNELERELKQQYNIPYLHHRLLLTLKEKVFLPRLTNLHIPKLWTNNNNESFNRNIKANNNWKVLKLPVLIDRLSDMEQDQMTDIRASIHGRGSYQLTGQAQVTTNTGSEDETTE